MFHAHKTEFAELGWMGFFRVGGAADLRRQPTAFCDPAAIEQGARLMEASGQGRLAGTGREPARLGAGGRAAGA